MVTLDALIADVVGQLIDDKLDRLKAELPDVIIERLKTDYSPDDLLNTVQVGKFLKV
ncbi:MAG: hypothetical protein LBP51_05865 [Deferribacteraceae bacterium]|jgi:hypothetical protein|nr:hypothetical protein [Deferribacteraceae bacterium]